MLESHFSEVQSQQHHTEMRQFDPDKRVDANDDSHKADQDRFDPDQRVCYTQTDCTNTSLLDESEIAKYELNTPEKALIEDSISTPDGLNKLLETQPELDNRLQDILNVLNDPDATPVELESANSRLSNLKGLLLEEAVKDAFKKVGLDINQERSFQEGESGITIPDVVANNNNDFSVTVLGISLQPGETISVECKCGTKDYLKSQLENHIPNQLSGQEGHRVLLTTSDIRSVAGDLAESVCKKYDAILVVLDSSVQNVNNTLKGCYKS